MGTQKRRSPGRMIRQDVSNSAKIASLSPEAAWLFFMLIPHFNAHGKINGGAGFVKDEVVPLIKVFTYENIPTLLEEISQKTNVKRYEVAGRWYLQSLNFDEHQDLRPERTSDDTLPSYSKSLPDNSRSNSGKLPEPPGLLPAQVEVELEVQGEVEDEVKESVSTHSCAPLKSGSRERLKSLFSKFWKAYPKKKSIHQAEKAFAKLNPNEQFLDRLLAAIERAKTSDQWRKDGGQFIPYPATWLNAKGWEDVHDVEVKAKPRENKFREQLRRHLAQPPGASHEPVGITDGVFDVEVVR